MAREIIEFDGREIKFNERSNDGFVSGRQGSIKIGVTKTLTNNKPWKSIWTIPAKVSSPFDFLAVGCLMLPTSHAVYIKSFDPLTGLVETINSHGLNGQLGPVPDNTFYEVNEISLTLSAEWSSQDITLRKP